MSDFEARVKNTPALQQLIGAIDKTMEDVHQRTNPKVRNFLGVDLGKVANYFPVSYGSRAKVQPKGDRRFIEDFAGMKERNLMYRGELRMDDALSTVNNYVSQASKFSAYAEPIGNIRKLIQQLESQGEPEKVKGMVEYMYDMIDNIQDYRAIQSITDNTWEKKIRQGMNNFTLAVLGWNPAVALKQVVSVVAAVPEIGYSALKSPKARAAAMEIIKSSYKDTKFKKGQIGQLNLNHPTLQKIMRLDPLHKQRFEGYIDRDQGEYRSTGMNPFSKKAKRTKVGKMSFRMDRTMEMIKIHDAAAIAFIYEALVEKNPELEKPGNEAKLRKALRNAVMRTQPTYNISSRTNLSRSNNTLMRLFTMFSSQRAKNMNMMADAIIRYLTNPDERAKKNMKATLLAIGVLSSIGIAVIDKLKYLLLGGGSDDDDWIDETLDVGAMAMLNTVGNVYFAGQFAQMVDANIRNKPFGKQIEHPVFQTVGIAAKGVADMTKGDFWKATDAGLQTGFRVIGAPLWPYTNIVRKGAKAVGKEDKQSKSAAEKYLPGKDVTTNKRWNNDLVAKGLENGQGALTASEKAAMINRQTQLIKADMMMRRQLMELTERRNARQDKKDYQRAKMAMELLQMKNRNKMDIIKMKERAYLQAEKIAEREARNEK
jgi:hypothetical protein